MRNKGCDRVPDSIVDFLFSEGGHSLIVKGKAGTGKTTFSLQLAELFESDRCYYVSSRVSDQSLYLQFPWLADKVKRDGARIGELRREFSRRELNKLEGQIELGGEETRIDIMNAPEKTIVVDLGSYLPEIELAYEKVEGNLPEKTLIVIDSIDGLSEKYGIEAARIINTLQKDLVEGSGANIIYVLEEGGDTQLDYLGDGIIAFNNVVDKGRRVRTLSIQKLRGRGIDTSEYLFSLSGGRVTTFPPLSSQMDRHLFSLDSTASTRGDGSEGGSLSDMVITDGLYKKGLKAGTINIVSLDSRLSLSLLNSIETAPIRSHARRRLGVVWVPSPYNRRTNPLDVLSGGGEDDDIADRIRVLEMPGKINSDSHIGCLDGKDMLREMGEERVQYYLEGSKRPFLYVLHYQTLKMIYQDKTDEQLLELLSRRGGDSTFIIMTGGENRSLTGVNAMAHSHLVIDSRNGVPLIYGIKPFTEHHSMICTDENAGYELFQIQ